MFGIVLSALNTVLGTTLALVFRTIVVKFVFFTCLFLAASELLSALQASGILPSASSVQAGFSMIPPGVGYILSVFNIYAGASMIFTAYLTRFIIRRIPFLN